MMKSNKIQDEIVLNQRRKIQSDGFQILYYVLIISVLIQQLVLKSPVGQYMVELLCFVGASIYIIISNIRLGNNITSGEYRNKRLYKIAITIGISQVIILVFLNREETLVDILTNIVVFVCVYIGGIYALDIFTKKRQDKIAKELDLDEDNIK